jgi:peroxiredoxin Q/BCP
MQLSVKQLVASVSALAMFAVGCSDVMRPDGRRGLLSVGASAPDFEARDATGTFVRLSTTPGARVVYFYPKDGTPGCTAEACAFRDSFDRYRRNHITVFGVSGGSEASHASFRKEHGLQFPLASDGNGSIAQRYGVATFVGMPSRITFVVNALGKITHVFKDVDPGVHADQVLAAATP